MRKVITLALIVAATATLGGCWWGPGYGPGYGRGGGGGWHDHGGGGGWGPRGDVVVPHADRAA